MQRLHPTPLLLHLRPTKRILPSLTHLHPSTTATTASLSTRRYSSGSPTKTTTPADHFIKTGEKPADPADQVSRSYEYSQSGGDDMVAQQSGASFDVRYDTIIPLSSFPLIPLPPCPVGMSPRRVCVSARSLYQPLHAYPTTYLIFSRERERDRDIWLTASCGVVYTGLPSARHRRAEVARWKRQRGQPA